MKGLGTLLDKPYRFGHCRNTLRLGVSFHQRFNRDRNNQLEIFKQMATHRLSLSPAIYAAN